jgi:hypothetical protein
MVIHALPDLYGFSPAVRTTCARPGDKMPIPTIHSTKKNKIN